MDDRKRKLSIIQEFTTGVERTLVTGTVKCEPSEPISLTDMRPPLPQVESKLPTVQPFSKIATISKPTLSIEEAIAASATFTEKFAISGNLDHVEKSLSKDVAALISKVGGTGKLFDSVHATLQDQIVKLDDNSYKEQVEVIFQESKALQKRARQLIWSSQKLAIAAAVFVDDFCDVADKVSSLLIDDMPMAEKLCTIASYTKWVDERSSDAEDFRNKFDTLKEDVSDLSAKRSLTISDEERSKVSVAQGSVTSWVQRDRFAQLLALSSLMVSGPAGWGMLAGGLAFKAICMDAAATARKARSDAEAPRLEATRMLKTCKDGFLTIADEISDFVNVWQLAGIVLIKISKQLSLTNVEQPEMLPERFNKLVRMFRGLRSSLEMYSAATFNL